MKKKNINEKIFNEFFNYHYPSFLVKDLYEDNENKNDKVLKNIKESLINLRNSNNSKTNSETENQKQIVSTTEKVLLSN